MNGDERTRNGRPGTPPSDWVKRRHGGADAPMSAEGAKRPNRQTKVIHIQAT